MFTSIAGRSVLITGGTKGIGKGMAAAFAAEGAQAVITGRDARLGERTAAELTAAGGGKVSYEAGDVSDPASCKAIVDATIERHGGIDVLCCNAGIFPAAPLGGDQVRRLQDREMLRHRLARHVMALA